MDMGDVLRGDSVEKTVTITNTGFDSVLSSQLSLIAAVITASLHMQHAALLNCSDNFSGMCPAGLT